ncbi:cytochrome P450 [Bacillus nakamurai]|uniref:cytochrome P450 n=1 Tax=Bacillus nakamurai TaxID=1793963 RepID=UPI0020C2E2F6|nr:cytochrome P450 [Bacillus nakamurai]MCP6683757.1 cytochrome P450 [Bacillus nakamurai]
MSKFKNPRQAVQKTLMKGKNGLDAYDPFPWYEKMRRENPVHFDEENKVWSVFLYDDVKKVIGDKEAFSSHRLQMTSSIGNSILNMDPPKHTRIRSVVNRAFTPRVLKEWEPRIQQITDDLLKQARGRGSIDIVKDLSYPLPVIVISELLGVPSEHMEQFKEWSDILVSTPKDESPEAAKVNEQEQDQCERELASFFARIIEEKRNQPGQDIISILIKAEEEGEKLSGEDLIPFCTLLLMAGNETTTNLISNAVYSIAETPGLYEELRQDPSLIPQVIEETLRFRAPAPFVRRTVKHDIELSGRLLKSGEMVLGYIASANRDEKKFEHAEVFDIRRQPNPHLSFGFGIHFCLGAPLARLEAEVALKGLLKTYHKLKPVRVEPIQNSVMYGLTAFEAETN